MTSNPRLPLMLALLTAVAVGGCTGDSANGAFGREAGSSVGTPAPTLAGKTIDGQRVALSDFRGQVVLVNVWATWCRPCKAELPELARLQREHAGQGFTVLGVSVDKRQALPTVKQMVAGFGLAYPNLFDPEGAALHGWEVVGYPTSVLVGRDGSIRWRRNGMIHPEDPELTKQLEAALAEAPPA